MTMTTTTDLNPTLQEALENLPEPDGLTKIVIQTLRDERGSSIGVAFARADNGMIVGAAQAGISQFGHAPQDTKYFISQQHAEDYTRDLCRVYLGREDVDFLRVEGNMPLDLVIPGKQRRRM